MTAALHTELWTSWASLLRSYAAAHGLNATEHAVIEVSADTITLRVGTRWLHFTSSALTSSDAAAPIPFALTDDGNVVLAVAPPEEMDFVAERLTRSLFQIGR